ncbi:MAG: hypothetical protein L3J29_10905 [Cyclobacteriaceae bacterium]|nr:hypothetical protein [Cyclobacteriaceae bacterium]
MRSTNANYIMLTLLLTVVRCPAVLSQELYQFKGATVVIELDYGDSLIQFQSRHLHVLLDNDNAEFGSKLEIGTLVNTKDGFEERLDLAADKNEVSLTGRFNVDHIETSNHAALNFEFSGVLTQNEVSIPIYGSAELQHIGGGGSISCMLGYSFEIDEETLRMNNVGYPNLRKVKVQVMQTILNRNNNY